MVLRTRCYHLQAVPKFLGVLNEAVLGGGVGGGALTRWGY
jgi:hypothetical protein